MPKTITFTANLLAEPTYEFETWNEGKTHRATSESFQVGGKGINVCKMLDRLGAENAAICFPGGAYGPICVDWLEKAGIELMPFTQGCLTRSGSVVRANDREETTFLGLDSVVSPEAVREAVEALRVIDAPFDFAICGSVQNWEDERWEPLREWVANRPTSVRLLVDNYGSSLPWFARQSPALIKINRDELELLFDEDRRGLPTNQLLDLATATFDCPHWVVTNGGEALWIKNESEAPQTFDPPKVECISPTGCGDIVFATVIDCLYNKEGYKLLSAAKLAADYASRSAALPGIAEFEL